MSAVGRPSAPYGTYLERTANPIANQGAVMANAAYNVGAKIAIQLENQRTAPSAYGNASDEQVWNIDPHDLLFTVCGSSGSMGDSRLQVLPCLNGLGVDASVLYPDDPEMIRQAVKNQVQYVGVAYQALRAVRGEVERGIAVQLGGLHTVRNGNGMFDEDVDTNLRPGDLLVADVPSPGQRGLHPGPGARVRQGTPATKYTLQVCTRSTVRRSSGTPVSPPLGAAGGPPVGGPGAAEAHCGGEQ